MRSSLPTRWSVLVCAMAFFAGVVCITPNAFAQCCPSPLPAIDPLLSSVTPGAGPIPVCLAGDLAGLSAPAAGILVRVRDCFGAPVIGLSPGEFEVDGSPLVAMSDGFNPGPPPRHDLNGFTVLAPGDYLLDVPLLAGGCGGALNVKVRGCLIVTGAPLPQPFVSPDLTANGVIDLADVGAFASCFYTAGCTCCDLVVDGICNLADVGLMAAHYGHMYPLGWNVDPID